MDACPDSSSELQIDRQLVEAHGFSYLDAPQKINGDIAADPNMLKQFNLNNPASINAIKLLMRFVNAPCITSPRDETHEEVRLDFMESNELFDKVDFYTIQSVYQALIRVQHALPFNLVELPYFIDISDGTFRAEHFDAFSLPERVVLVENIALTLISFLEQFGLELHHTGSADDPETILRKMGFDIQYMNPPFTAPQVNLTKYEHIGIGEAEAQMITEILGIIAARPMIFDEITDNQNRRYVRTSISNIYGIDVYRYYEQNNQLKFNNVQQIYQLFADFFEGFIINNNHPDAVELLVAINELYYYDEYKANQNGWLRSQYNQLSIDDKVALQRNIQSTARSILELFA